MKQSADPPDSTISVIVPMFNAEPIIERCLQPLLAMQERGEIREIIVVNDCSTDASLDVVAQLDVKLLDNGRRAGPGAARNLGSKAACSDVLWFVDSDVIVADIGAALISRAFRDFAVAAVFGSYDDAPAAANFLSQYKNLVHRYYHQAGRVEASTFWAGCGAVRAEVFRDTGGFDAVSYPFPSIEDIELGNRIRQAGFRIRLLPELQGKHLKEWRFVNLIHTEIFRRAIPWSRLMLKSGVLTDDLNVAVGERIRALMAVTLAALTALSIFGLVSWGLPLAFAAAVAIANGRLIGFFFRNRGVWFTVRALAFHQLYYLYSSAAFLYVIAGRLVRPQREPPGGFGAP